MSILNAFEPSTYRYEFVGTVTSISDIDYLYSVGFIGRFMDLQIAAETHYMKEPVLTHSINYVTMPVPVVTFDMDTDYLVNPTIYVTMVETALTDLYQDNMLTESAVKGPNSVLQGFPIPP